MYLVDTNVISELAPSKREASAELVEWLDRASPWLFLSVITAMEITAGIRKAEREGASTKARALRAWWTVIEQLYGERVLTFNLRCATAAGTMLDEARAFAPGVEDIAIAATAQAHGFQVLTRNVRHFAPLGVRAINPFETLPALP